MPLFCLSSHTLIPSVSSPVRVSSPFRIPTKLLRESQTALKTLQEKTEAASLIENNERQARYYHDEVNTAMEALRKPIDQLEMIVDKEMWPMPSYGDLMFEV